MAHSDRCEEHGEDAVHHDDEKDRFDHRVGRLFAKRLGAALHLKPFDASDDTDHQRHERRLDYTHFKRRDGDRLPQPRQKDFRLDPSVQPRDQPAAVKRCHRPQECEQRNGDYQCKNARKN